MNSPVDHGTGVGDGDHQGPATMPAAAPRLPLFEDGNGDWQHLRGRMADAARVWGTSKQSVSRLVKAGKITLGPDGLLDIAQATRQYLANTNPSKIRARILAPLVRDLQSAQAREAALRNDLAQARAELEERLAKEAELREELAFAVADAWQVYDQACALAAAVRDLWADLDELEPPARADFLEGLPELLLEGWGRLSALPPEQRAPLLRRALQEKTKGEQPAPGELEEFLNAMESPPNPPSHDEDDDDGT